MVTDPVTRRRELAIAYEDTVIPLAARNVRTMDVDCLLYTSDAADEV